MSSFEILKQFSLQDWYQLDQKAVNIFKEKIF